MDVKLMMMMKFLSSVNLFMFIQITVNSIKLFAGLVATLTHYDQTF